MNQQGNLNSKYPSLTLVIDDLILLFVLIVFNTCKVQIVIPIQSPSKIMQLGGLVSNDEKCCTRGHLTMNQYSFPFAPNDILHLRTSGPHLATRQCVNASSRTVPAWLERRSSCSVMGMRWLEPASWKPQLSCTCSLTKQNGVKCWLLLSPGPSSSKDGLCWAPDEQLHCMPWLW